MAKRLECDLAIIDKRRPKPNEAKVMNIIGEVKNRTCVIIDDLVDTANTLCEAAQALKDHGAKSVIAYSTHAVLSGNAVQRIEKTVLDEMVVTDTIPVRDDALACEPICQLSLGKLLFGVMLAFGLGYLHLLTGLAYEFHVFFVMPVLAVAWFLGRGPAYVIASAEAGVWFAADRMLDGGQAAPFALLSNTSMRLAIFLFVA